MHNNNNNYGFVFAKIISLINCYHGNQIYLLEGFYGNLIDNLSTQSRSNHWLKWRIFFFIYLYVVLVAGSDTGEGCKIFTQNIYHCGVMLIKKSVYCSLVLSIVSSLRISGSRLRYRLGATISLCNLKSQLHSKVTGSSISQRLRIYEHNWQQYRLSVP